MNTPKPLIVIGRAELVRLVDCSEQNLPAKIDTGADISSIWATAIAEDAAGLHFTLFDRSSKFYDGRQITIPKGKYRLTRIANSFGVKELRYVVKLRVEVKGRIIRASFSLADRSLKTYPMLLGRRLLKGKFLVDVSRGQALVEAETDNKVKLNRDLEKR